MKKEMTLKEFKDVLNKAGLNFDLIGYDGILNMIALCYRTISEQAGDNSTFSELYRKTSDVIHDDLKERGFYK